MRIRSTKPEFWRSARIASVPWDARLVLKGLESYVDDNGVGRDDIALIVGDVFSRDMLANPRETVARVSEAISLLHQAGLVWRYEAEGDRLIYISWWESIQRIDRPGKGRLPRPDGTIDYKSSEIRESVASPRESVAPGTGEQGNRGTGEQGSPPAVSDVPSPARVSAEIVRAQDPSRGTSRASKRLAELNSTARSSQADEFARAFGQWAGGGIPQQTLIEIAQEVDPLIADGIDARQIADGIKRWHASDRLYPSQIPTFVAKAARRPDGAQTKATQRAADTLTIADQLIAEFTQEIA